jgi:hypothetical protein
MTGGQVIEVANFTVFTVIHKVSLRKQPERRDGPLIFTDSVFMSLLNYRAWWQTF